MSLDIIQGKWIGYFKYGKGYSKEDQAQSVSFMIEMNCEEGLIKGICTDDLTRELFLEPAIVEGIFEAGSINFIKRYPCLVTVDENYKTVALPNEPSFGIQYDGKLKKKFFSGKYFLKGEWDISGSYIDEWGDAQYYSSDGTWWLKKIR